MTNSRNLFTELDSASRQQWAESGKWLLFVVIGGLLPIWGGYLLLIIFSQPTALWNFASNGELALYSAALLTPALYLVGRDVTDPFVHRQMFMLFGMLLLVIAALLFAAATAAGTTQNAELVGIKLNKDVLVTGSSWLLVCAVLYAFIVNLLDVVLLRFDPSVSAANDREALALKFRTTDGGDNDGEE